MPSDFPQQAYEEIHAHLGRYQGQHEHGLFIGAWSGLSYRFRAAAEYDEAVTLSLITHGGGPPPDERYAQERDLFGFVSNAFSALESFYFAMFTIGSLTGHAAFQLRTDKDERAVSPSVAVAAFKAAFPADTATNAFEDITTDSAFSDLRRFRNILTHRRSPPRHHALHVGSPRPSATHIGGGNMPLRPLDAGTTPALRRELTRLLTFALSAASAFVQRNL